MTSFIIYYRLFLHFNVLLLFVVRRLCRDFKLHVEEIEPVDKITKKYGFTQQIKTFVVEKPTQPDPKTNVDLGRNNRYLSSRDLLFRLVTVFDKITQMPLNV